MKAIKLEVSMKIKEEETSYSWRTVLESEKSKAVQIEKLKELPTFLKSMVMDTRQDILDSLYDYISSTMATTPQSIEDLAVTHLAGEGDPMECYCQEFAHRVVHQAAEIKVLKEKLKDYITAYLKLLEDQPCRLKL